MTEHDGPRMIVLLAEEPEVRAVCPAEWAAGYWLEIRPDADSILLTPNQGYELGDRRLMARPSGKMVRHEETLLSAPVWVVRWEEYDPSQVG